ncbi:hypothetical protein GCM10020220_064550 [Nonomuraea rubra]
MNSLDGLADDPLLGGAVRLVEEPDAQRAGLLVGAAGSGGGRGGAGGQREQGGAGGNIVKKLHYYLPSATLESPARHGKHSRTLLCNAQQHVAKKDSPVGWSACRNATSPPRSGVR